MLFDYKIEVGSAFLVSKECLLNAFELELANVLYSFLYAVILVYKIAFLKLAKSIGLSYELQNQN